VALIDAHGPPKAHALLSGYQLCQFFDLADGKTTGCRTAIQGEIADMLSKEPKPVRVRGDPVLLDMTVGDQPVRKTVQHDQITLGLERQVTGRFSGGFGLAWIENHDGGLVPVPLDPLPEDRVGDDGIRADEDEAVALLGIPVGIGGASKRRLACRPLQRSPCTDACCRRYAGPPCRNGRNNRERPSLPWAIAQ